MAARVLTEAQTDTPWRYGAALHMNAPNRHPARGIKMALVFLIQKSGVRKCTMLKNLETRWQCDAREARHTLWIQFGACNEGNKENHCKRILVKE